MVRFVSVVASCFLLGGCVSICDEVVDEAEANGCALAAPPGGGAVPEEPECEGARERQAQCLLDLTSNVCAITEEESADLAACYEADGVE
jgi:hypothetical protein